MNGSRWKRLLFGESSGIRVARTAVTSVITRGTSLLTLLLTVPIVLRHVGAERYGVWMAAISLATLFTIADGGITNGMISPVAHAFGAGDMARIRVLVASALVTTTALCVTVLAITLIIVQFVDWTWLFNVSDLEIGREAELIFTVFCFCYALSFPATVIRQTRLGLMQGDAVNLWDFSGTLFALALLLAAVTLGSGLVGIAIAWAVGPVAARWLNAIVFLAGNGRAFRPAWTDIQPFAMQSLLFGGGAFLLFAVAQTVAVQSDQLLIARILGATYVTDYSIVQRLFSQPQSILFLLLAAQWPAYAEAAGRGDHDWIQRQFSRTLIGAVFFGIATCAMLAIFMHPILVLWGVSKTVSPSPLLVASMAIYGTVAVIANVFIYFFFALGLYRRVILALVAMIAIDIPLALLLIPRIGAAGACIATTCGYLVALVIPSIFTIRGVLQELRAPCQNTLAGTPSSSSDGPGLRDTTVLERT